MDNLEVPFACPSCGSREADAVNEDEPICDFCSDVPVVKDYDVEDYRQADFVAEGTVLQLNSMGKWAACAACAEFIDRDDREGLALHSVKRLGTTLPKELLAFSLISIKEAHAGFFRALKKE